MASCVLRSANKRTNKQSINRQYFLLPFNRIPIALKQKRPLQNRHKYKKKKAETFTGIKMIEGEGEREVWKDKYLYPEQSAVQATLDLFFQLRWAYREKEHCEHLLDNKKQVGKYNINAGSSYCLVLHCVSTCVCVCCIFEIQFGCSQHFYYMRLFYNLWTIVFSPCLPLTYPGCAPSPCYVANGQSVWI